MLKSLIHHYNNSRRFFAYIHPTLFTLLGGTMLYNTDNQYLTQPMHDKLAAFYKDKKVLVTGGCGFIGSHIVELLTQLGADITILDDLSTGFEHNITSVRDRVTLLRGSITDPECCIRAAQEKDIIFHLAAFTSVPDSVARPELCHSTNVDGTFNILNAARINHVKRFIFSSSSAVYGQATGISSENDACDPLSPYGYSKLIGEQLCSQFSKNYAIKTVMLRYFNVHGPRQNPHAQYAAVVAKFSDRMRENKSLTIFGDGTQTRDFVHVHYVAYANILAGMMASTETSNKCFNIASGKSINLFELIDQLKKEFPHYNGPILFEPTRAGDVLHTGADCRRFKETFIQNSY